MSRCPLLEEFLDEVLPEPPDRKKWEFIADKWDTDRDHYMVNDAREYIGLIMQSHEMSYIAGTLVPTTLDYNLPFYHNMNGGPITVEMIPKILDQRNISILNIYYEFLRWRLKNGK